VVWAEIKPAGTRTRQSKCPHTRPLLKELGRAVVTLLIQRRHTAAAASSVKDAPPDHRRARGTRASSPALHGTWKLDPPTHTHRV